MPEENKRCDVDCTRHSALAAGVRSCDRSFGDKHSELGKRPCFGHIHSLHGWWPRAEKILLGPRMVKASNNIPFDGLDRRRVKEIGKSPHFVQSMTPRTTLLSKDTLLWTRWTAKFSV